MNAVTTSACLKSQPWVQSGRNRWGAGDTAGYLICIQFVIAFTNYNIFYFYFLWENPHFTINNPSKFETI